MDHQAFGKYLGFIGLIFLVISAILATWAWNADISIDELLKYKEAHGLRSGMEYREMMEFEHDIRLERMIYCYWSGGIGIGLLILAYGIYSSARTKD